MKREVGCRPLLIRRRLPFFPQHVPSLTIHSGELGERDRYIDLVEDRTRTVTAR